MTSRKLKKGDYIIINTTDRPEAKSIAQISSIQRVREDKYKIFAMYLSEAVARNYGRKEYCFAVRESLDGVTPTLVTDFGVNITIEDGYIFVTNNPDMKSRAHYEDGAIRQWQGFHHHAVDKAKLRLDFAKIAGKFHS